VNRLRDKYDEARDRLQDSEDANGSLDSAIEESESTILNLRSQNDRLHGELADAEFSITSANYDRDRIQLSFNELTRTVQTVQQDRDDTRAEFDRMRIATTTDESMLARLHRSDAQVSQQTIVTLRRQIATTTATHEASTHLHHTSPTILWHPWVHPNY
jgi:chromosome segregation ATPase